MSAQGFTRVNSHDGGETLRAARDAAGISWSVMATRTHYSKPCLSMVETGKRAATTDVISAYERVLGIGQLGDEVNRRDFFKVTGLVAGNAKVAADLSASVAGNDPSPLATVQTTHGTDLAIAALADRGMVADLRRWLDAGARWCAAAMLQALSPMIGR